MMCSQRKTRPDLTYEKGKTDLVFIKAVSWITLSDMWFNSLMVTVQGFVNDCTQENGINVP